MFKKYRFEWEGKDGKKSSADFFVHSKGTRSGFMHRACVIGPLPRLDDMGNDWAQYRENEEVLFKKRVAKCSYCNRTWECWPGQQCLSKLWEQLAKLKFLDMGRISEGNPFGDNEPKCEDIREPDELFDGFKR
jgi:hypothetical protein